MHYQCTSPPMCRQTDKPSGLRHTTSTRFNFDIAVGRSFCRLLALSFGKATLHDLIRPVASESMERISPTGDVMTKARDEGFRQLTQCECFVFSQIFYLIFIRCLFLKLIAQH